MVINGSVKFYNFFCVSLSNLKTLCWHFPFQCCRAFWIVSLANLLSCCIYWFQGRFRTLLHSWGSGEKCLWIQHWVSDQLRFFFLSHLYILSYHLLHLLTNSSDMEVWTLTLTMSCLSTARSTRGTRWECCRTSRPSRRPSTSTAPRTATTCTATAARTRRPWRRRGWESGSWWRSGSNLGHENLRGAFLRREINGFPLFIFWMQIDWMLNDELVENIGIWSFYWEFSSGWLNADMTHSHEKALWIIFSRIH